MTNTWLTKKLVVLLLVVVVVALMLVLNNLSKLSAAMRLLQPAPNMPGAQLQQPAPNMPGAQLQQPAPSMPGAQLQQPAPNMPGAQLQQPEPPLPGAQSGLVPGTPAPPVQNAAPPKKPPLLESRDEQVKMGEKLYQEMIVNEATFKCSNNVTIRNTVEGSWTYCGDKDFQVKAPCLIFSFGVAYDFAFEDALAKNLCTVYSFDPSMTTPDHRRGQYIMFYQIGLGAKDTGSFSPRLDGYVLRPSQWRMKTMKTLLKELNRTNSIIDILKMDIECYEWDVVRNMLDTGILVQVKQLLLEWHIFPNCPARNKFQQMYATLQDLLALGFEPFHKDHFPPNTGWASFNLQSNYGYVNTKFLGRT